MSNLAGNNQDYTAATAYEEGVRNETKIPTVKKNNPSNPQNLSREEILCAMEAGGACSPYSF